MPTITALEAQRRGGRVNVHLDGEFAFGLSETVVARAGLRVGGTLTEAQLRTLLEDDEYQVALNRALYFLTPRPRSEREVAQRLKRARVASAIIERVLVRLREMGLADDRAFARYWVENREAHNPRGSRLLSAELRQRGVDRPIIDEALPGLGDEGEAAVTAGRRKVRQLAGLDYREFSRRLGGFLARRGFDYETAREAVDRLWREAGGGPGAE